MVPPILESSLPAECMAMAHTSIRMEIAIKGYERMEKRKGKVCIEKGMKLRIQYSFRMTS